MNVIKPKEKVDFIVDQAFVDSLVDPGVNDIIKIEMFYQFYPLYHLYLLYLIIDQIHDRDECPEEDELKKMGLNSSAIYNLSRKFEEEILIYRFIQNIMLNRIDAVKALLDQNVIKLHLDLDQISLFQYAGKAPNVYGFNYVTLAAALGRTEMVRLFIEKKANPSKIIYYDTVKQIPVPLSVNECLIMNALYRWYKSEKVATLNNAQAEDLIDTMILASKKAPSIVSKDHLLEQGIRVSWYWTSLNNVINNIELLKKLIPLNSEAMKENLGITN